MVRRIHPGIGFLAGLSVALASPSALDALTVAHLNLRELTERADRIVRGTVLEATPGRARIGNSEIPIFEYQVRVDESFKGTFRSVKGVRYIDIRMVAGLGPNLRSGFGLRGRMELPTLEKGQQYLLFLSAPSSVGLSSTIGLGQGKYRITRVGRVEHALNDFGNRALFRGMDSEGLPDRGPIGYGRLRDRIQKLVGQRRR